MLNVCQRTSHVCSHTVALSFVSTVRDRLSLHTLRNLCNFESHHLLFLYPRHHWHSWLLGRRRGNWSERLKTLIPPDRSLRRLTTTSHHTLSAVDVACSYRHATVDIAPVTCGPSCPPAPMMGSCERKDCIWLSIRPHLEHLRQRSESLACCNWSVAGVRGELSERSFCQYITWALQEKSCNSEKKKKKCKKTRSPFMWHGYCWCRTLRCSVITGTVCSTGAFAG